MLWKLNFGVSLGRLLLIVLLICPSRFATNSQISNPSVLVVQYADLNAQQYSLDAYNVNTKYFRQYDLDSVVFPQALHNPNWRNLAERGLIDSQKDKRWEKVACLLTMVEHFIMHCHNIVHGHECPTYIVWMDSDIIIADFRSDFVRDMVNANPGYDLYISSEFHTETGVANTGMFILRTSMWSLQWLQQWWAQDHGVGHDQILFDVLYREILSTNPGFVSEHILILPSRSLNSHPPAYLTFSETDHVLHLMGERADFRKIVFSHALDMISRSRNHSTPEFIDHIVNLGLTQEWMSNALWNLIQSKQPQLVEQLMEFLRTPSLDLCSTILNLHVVVSLMGEFRELGLQLQQLLSLRPIHEVYRVRARRSEWLMGLFRGWELLWTGLQSDVTRTCSQSLLAQAKVDVLNILGWLGHDYLQELLFLHNNGHESLELVDDMYRDIDKYLRQLYVLVQPTSRRLVQEMLAIHAQNRAFYHLQSPTTQHPEIPLLFLVEAMSWHLVDPFADVNGPPNKEPRNLNDIMQQVLSVEAPWQITHLNEYQFYDLLSLLGEQLCRQKREKNYGLKVLEVAAQCWERLLRISTLDEDTSTRRWQDGHGAYLQVLQHASRCSDRVSAGWWVDRQSMLQQLFPNEMNEFQRHSAQSTQVQIEPTNDGGSRRIQAKKFRRKTRNIS